MVTRWVENKLKFYDEGDSSLSKENKNCDNANHDSHIEISMSQWEVRKKKNILYSVKKNKKSCTLRISAPLNETTEFKLKNIYYQRYKTLYCRETFSKKFFGYQIDKLLLWFVQKRNKAVILVSSMYYSGAQAINLKSS